MVGEKKTMSALSADMTLASDKWTDRQLFYKKMMKSVSTYLSQSEHRFKSKCNVYARKERSKKTDNV